MNGEGDDRQPLTAEAKGQVQAGRRQQCMVDMRFASINTQSPEGLPTHLSRTGIQLKHRLKAALLTAMTSLNFMGNLRRTHAHGYTLSSCTCAPYRGSP